jgi:hypothetical protein
MSNTKKFGILAGLALALAFISYGVGRYSQPAKVVTVEKVKEVQVVKEVKVIDEEATKAAIANLTKQNDVRVKIVRVKTPDGTVTTTTEKEDKSKTEKETKVTETETTKTTETKTEVKVVEREVTKTVERSRPNWRVSVQGGYDLVGKLGDYGHHNYLPADSNYLRHMVLGATVERRLLGPLSGGFWGTTQGIVGASVSLEF